jgi:hypothetical protein
MEGQTVYDVAAGHSASPVGGAPELVLGIVGEGGVATKSKV